MDHTFFSNKEYVHINPNAQVGRKDKYISDWKRENNLGKYHEYTDLFV